VQHDKPLTPAAKWVSSDSSTPGDSTHTLTHAHSHTLTHTFTHTHARKTHKTHTQTLPAQHNSQLPLQPSGSAATAARLETALTLSHTHTHTHTTHTHTHTHTHARTQNTYSHTDITCAAQFPTYPCSQVGQQRQQHAWRKDTRLYFEDAFRWGLS